MTNMACPLDLQRCIQQTCLGKVIKTWNTPKTKWGNLDIMEENTFSLLLRMLSFGINKAI